MKGCDCNLQSVSIKHEDEIREMNFNEFEKLYYLAHHSSFHMTLLCAC